MSLLRRYRSSLVLNKPLNTHDGLIINTIKNIIDNLVPKKCDTYPDDIFYCIGNEIYFKTGKTLRDVDVCAIMSNTFTKNTILKREDDIYLEYQDIIIYFFKNKMNYESGFYIALFDYLDLNLKEIKITYLLK